MTMDQEHKTASAGPAPASSRKRGAESISELIRDLATDLSSLIGKEIELGKSEMRESVSEVKTAVGAIATGAVIAMAGVLVLLMSAVYGLSIIVAPWLAALIVGAAALLVGYMMVNSAKGKMSASSMAPDRTMASVQKDSETFKRTIQ